MQPRLDAYLSTLTRLIRDAETSDYQGRSIPLGDGFAHVRAAAHRAHDRGNNNLHLEMGWKPAS